MDNIKSILDLLVALYSAYVSATAGGAKLSWASLIKIGPALLLIPNAVNNAKAALAEFEALSPADDQALSNYVTAQLPSVDTATLAKVKAALDLLLRLGGGVNDVIVLFQKAATPVVASVGAPALELEAAPLPAPGASV